MLTTAIEYGFWEQKQKFNSEDIELIAKRHLEERCIEPIQRQLTEETNFPYIAVAGESDGTPTLSRIIVCCSGTELQA